MARRRLASDLQGAEQWRVLPMVSQWAAADDAVTNGAFALSASRSRMTHIKLMDSLLVSRRGP